jgi:hypothetical protein
MRTQLVRRYTSLVVGASLAALYATLLYYVGAGGILLPSGLFAVSVFILEAAKLAAAIAIPRLRNGSWQLLYFFETAEILALPAAYGLLLGLHYPSAGLVVARFVRVYLASQAILIPPFSIYTLARSMSKEGGAGSVLVSTVMQFGLLSYLLELATVASGGAQGLEGLGNLMIPSSGTVALPQGSIEAETIIGLAGGILYISTMAYIVTDFVGLGLSPKTVVISSIATLAAAAWVVVTGTSGSVSGWLAGGDFAMLLAVWWIARG